MSDVIARPAPRLSRGVALLTAVVVVAIATIAAVGMASRQQVDIRKTENVLRLDQAWEYALSIEGWAAGRLVKDREANKIDSKFDVWGYSIAPTQVVGGELAAQISDLQGRFNLNNLVNEGEPSQQDVTRFRRLLALLDIDVGVADALLDWMDSDMVPRYPAGAEDESYTNRQPPYRAANRPLAHIAELLLIEGVDVVIYEKLRPHVTVLPGRVSINVNTASSEVLRCLANGITAESVEMLLLTRDRNPFEKVQDFLQHDALAGLKVEVAGIGVESSYFLIEGDVRMGRLLLRHRSVMHRPQKGGVQVIRRSRKGVFDG
jgi:general secretion pathway protein K